MDTTGPFALVGDIRPVRVTVPLKSMGVTLIMDTPTDKIPPATTTPWFSGNGRVSNNEKSGGDATICTITLIECDTVALVPVTFTANRNDC